MPDQILDQRIDYYPTHEHQGFKFRPGRPIPFGATLVPNGVNFSIFSSAATSCTLVLFEKRASKPMVEIPFPEEFRIGNVYCMIVFDRDFDWEEDRHLEIPIEDLVIYEMHVRSFTRHPSSGVKYPGTFAAIREKIPYLKELGVNCLELMPIFEFDEWESNRQHPETGELLVNYW